MSANGEHVRLSGSETDCEEDQASSGAYPNTKKNEKNLVVLDRKLL